MADCFGDAIALERARRRSPNNLRARDARWRALALDERNAPAATSEVERKHGAADARTDDDDVEAHVRSVDYGMSQSIALTDRQILIATETGVFLFPTH